MLDLFLRLIQHLACTSIAGLLFAIYFAIIKLARELHGCSPLALALGLHRPQAIEPQAHPYRLAGGMSAGRMCGGL